MPDSSVQNGQKQIPGFYYDASKKRYFKIAHTASGGDYTAASIAKRIKLERVAKEDAAQEEAIAKVKSLQKRYSLPIALQVIQDRAIGRLQPVSRECVLSSVFRTVEDRGRSLRDYKRRGKAAYNTETSELYVASVRFIEQHDMTRNEFDDRQCRRSIPLVPLSTTATSLHAGSGTVIATTIGEGNRPAELIIKTDYGGKIAAFEATLWCSAIRPGTTRHAVAAGSSIFLYDINAEKHLGIPMPGKSHIKATEFLDDNVVAFAARNGSVYLYDVRSRDTAATLRFKLTHDKQHKTQRTGIVNMKSIHPQALVISGVPDTMDAYDLRFLKQNMPLVCFPHHKNESDITLDAMAISGNLLAAAQSSGGFNLWNLVDGQYLGTKSSNRRIDDMLFPLRTSMEDDVLWTLSGCQLHEWSFDADESKAFL